MTLELINGEKRKVIVNWREFGEMIDSLAGKIKESSLEFDGLYGIPRGGLPVAVALSHRLGLTMLAHPTTKTLVVNDISDYRKTLASMKNKKIATLFSTKWTAVQPDWFLRLKESEDDWIVFP
ncbi:MAG: hypothetical protein KJ718_00590 [Nanoarchaeota archaeon]|nr:hypothetical protein [Nanoarchaeota archaeon]MBU1051038.1 hypothetical protein [Nanoarchaeota archaeon]MBU1989040.1 hypothetical protein [Nanoarchaeota archaeon]